MRPQKSLKKRKGKYTKEEIIYWVVHALRQRPQGVKFIKRSCKNPFSKGARLPSVGQGQRGITGY